MSNNLILFSAVGHSDPVSNKHDGAILHICRHYKPSKVYLIYSKEMCEIRDSDNRFEAAIDDLNKRECLDIKCEAILKPELEDVHRFDDLVDIMKGELEKIHTANSGSEILLNVSSGTPAMKGAFILIANLLPASYKLKVIQVSAPERTWKAKEDDNKELSKKIFEDIKNNSDFAQDSPDRTYVEPMSNIYSEIVKKDICAHVDAYDYPAAIRQLEEIYDHNGKISDRVRKLLDAANLRLNGCDASKIKKLLSADETSKVFGKIAPDLFDLSEYALWMNIKLKSNQITDFIRGLTPICYELPIKYLKYVLKKDILTIRWQGKNGDVFNYKKENTILYKECMDILNQAFPQYGYDNKRPWSSESLIELVRKFGADQSDIADFDALRNYEQCVRNKIAHTIGNTQTALSSGNLTPEDAWKKLCHLLCRIFNMDEQGLKCYLESYDKMNEIIKSEVMKAV